MVTNAVTTFKYLYEKTSQAFSDIREIALSPENKKIPREWGISETAEMVGRTAQTLRNIEDSGKLPKARVVKKGKREERVYNLKEINLLREYFKTRPSKPKGCQPAIIGFANFKGGVTKTTTTVNVGQPFAMKGYRVLAIDGDSQASLTQMFGHIPDEHIDEKETLLDILTGESNDIRRIIKKTHWDGLDIIPANLGLYNTELILPTQITKYATETGKVLPFHNRLNESLKAVYDDYDLILIDCPPSMGMVSINAVWAANALVITMPPSMVDFASTKQFFKMLMEIMERLPSKVYAFTRILLTKFSDRRVAKDINETLKTYIGSYLMSSQMVASEAISKAGAEMKTLYEVDKFIGSKSTYTRALQYADLVNKELESLIKTMWEKSVAISTRENAINEGS